MMTAKFPVSLASRWMTSLKMTWKDILTERLVGLNCCLSEISYDVVGVEPDENFLHIRVSGYVDDVDYLESQCDK